MRYRAKEIEIGTRYGHLVVLREAEPGGARGNERRYECQCDCGRTAIVMATKLRYGKTRSCGCLSQAQRFRKKKVAKKHIGPDRPYVPEDISIFGYDKWMLRPDKVY